MDGKTEKINMTSTTKLSPDEKTCEGKVWSDKYVFKNIQKAKMDSDNNAVYANKATKIICGTFAITCLIPSLLGLPIAMLVHGIIYKDQCPVEPFVPIYMIVAPSVSIAKLIIDYVIRIKKWCQKRGPLDEEDVAEKIFGGISSLMGLFIFAFFIAGNVWVFRVYAPGTDPTASTYCNPKVYWFAFGTIIAAWSLGALAIFLCCCCACCAACYAAGKASEDCEAKS